MDFEILFDDSFFNLNTETTLTPIEKKRVLSIVNDFADGEWRYGKFQNFIWDNIAETALSYKDRMALINNSHSSLTESAKKLRLTDLMKDQKNQGSELAEIALYGIMKHHYKALPVVPKIFYKQNPQDNAKGADSVHIVVEPDNSFSVWFGEAKFYNSIADERLYEIVTSVENSLKTEKIEKENSIITNLTDLSSYLSDKPELFKDISDLLAARTSIDQLKPKLHIPILLLHECELTANCDQLTDEYKKEIIAFHKERAESYFKKQINKSSSSIFKYEDISFHLILFPVPSKEPIIQSFVRNVTHYKNQD